MAGMAWDPKGSYQTALELALSAPGVDNRFNNYSNAFSFGDMKSLLDKIYGTAENKILRNTAEDIATQQEGTASNLASRGITGGSIVNNELNKVASGVNKGKYDALSKLGIGKAGQTLNLQDMFNKLKFMTTKAASDVDIQNFLNQLKQAGVISGIESAKTNAEIAKANQPNIWSDIFAAGGDLAKMFPSIMKLFPGGAVGAA